MIFWTSQTLALAPTLTSFVTLGESLNPSKSYFHVINNAGLDDL